MVCNMYFHTFFCKAIKFGFNYFLKHEVKWSLTKNNLLNKLKTLFFRIKPICITN